MSKAYQFPADEPNPFAEKTVEQPQAGVNPYAAGVGPADRAAQFAGAYQSTLPARSGTLLALGIVSVVGSLAALLLAYWCLPLGFFMLMITIPAWGMARHDLRAMRQGAMSADAEATVRIARGMAIFGTVVSAIALLLPVGIFFWAWQ